MSQQPTHNTLSPAIKNDGFRYHALSDLESRFDWARVCGRGDFEPVRALFQRWCGPFEVSGRGRGYLQQLDASNSSTLLLGMTQSPQSWQVDIPGQAVAHLYGDSLIQFLRALLRLPEARLTRLDAAIDLRGSGLGSLLTNAARLNLQETWRRGGKNIQSVGLDGGTTVMIGSAKSPNFVRFYDKGAEQGTGPGHWLRWEAQFNRAHAVKIGPMLLERNDWDDLAQELAAGAITNLPKKTPELFDILRSERTISLKADLVERDWDRYCLWLHTQVYPTLALISEATGLPITEVVRQTGIEKASPPARRNRHSGLITGALQVLTGTIPECHTEKDIA